MKIAETFWILREVRRDYRMTKGGSMAGRNAESKSAERFNNKKY
ncbi:MAG: hypothetical protein ACO3FQ_08060 [Terrimicrobiaceae bacterium]